MKIVPSLVKEKDKVLLSTGILSISIMIFLKVLALNFLVMDLSSFIRHGRDMKVYKVSVFAVCTLRSL